MLTPKFVRAIYQPLVGGQPQSFATLLKLAYEFWGFCINGDNNLTGAIGSTKGFPSGSINMPNGFETGTLHASGSDGVTHLGFPYFSSSTGNFTGSLIGKHLVAWQSGSQSTDDSIYEIVQVIDAATLRVNTMMGGTPTSASNYIPTFTDRSSINYRIVDITTTANLTYVSGNNLVFNVNGAPDVNVGQLRPQIKIGMSFASNNLSARMTLAPSGTWNGTLFTEGNNEFTISTGASNGNDWGSAGDTPGPTYFTLIGSRDFLFAQTRGPTTNAFPTSSGFYWEIPDRLYPQINDPNPLAGALYGADQSAISTVKGWNCFNMVCQDNKVRPWRTIFRCPTGLYDSSIVYGGLQYAGTPTTKYGELSFNRYNGTIPFMEAVLHQPVGGQFCLARCRLRRLRFNVNSLPLNEIVGTDVTNSWYHMFDTVWIPWDGARIPQGPFPLGA